MRHALHNVTPPALAVVLLSAKDKANPRASGLLAQPGVGPRCCGSFSSRQKNSLRPPALSCKSRLKLSIVRPQSRIEEVTRVSEQLEHSTLAEMTAEIVSAYVSHHQILPAEVPGLIGSVALKLATLGTEQAEAAPAKPQPVVPVRRSVGRDHITCLICAKKQKLLKRHLAAAHGLTPAEYRDMFALKSDYPMTAPSYVEMRSEIARRTGLGRPKKAPARRTKAKRPAR